MKQLITLIAVLIIRVLTGQISVADTMTATEMVQYLVGSGVTISNDTLNCPQGASGSFNGINSNIGIDAGIVLTSGDINNVPGPNNTGSAMLDNFSPGDTDLGAITFPASTFDACILEFDVTPIGDSIKFNYVFGSEEYPEYVTSFNDVFAFFISGPGLPFQNIALVPGTTTPVSISNVNNGMNNTGPCTNCAYYVNNGNGTTPGNNPTVGFDGFTTALQAVVAVNPYQTYHLKIAVADAVDGIYDSGVFLEKGSLSSNVSTEVSSPTNSFSIVSWPNPVEDKLSIQTDVHFDHIAVYNALGSEISVLLNREGRTININTSRLRSGIYLLEIGSKNKQTIHRFLKK